MLHNDFLIEATEVNRKKERNLAENTGLISSRSITFLADKAMKAGWDLSKGLDLAVSYILVVGKPL